MSLCLRPYVADRQLHYLFIAIQLRSAYTFLKASRITTAVLKQLNYNLILTIQKNSIFNYFKNNY